MEMPFGCEWCVFFSEWNSEMGTNVLIHHTLLEKLFINEL